MKITSSVKQKELKPITFPAHFQSKHNGTIVLFFDEKYGVVVQSNTPSMERVGEFRDTWSSCVKSGNWNRVEYKTTFED